MSATITPIRQVIANCSRCDAWVTDEQSTVTITVAHETWHGGNLPEVVVDKAHVALIFCRRCAPLYDFKRIAVGRRNTEEDEIIIKQANDAEIEANRAAAGQDLRVAPGTLTAEQIRGWILEQEWNALEAEGFFDSTTAAP